MDNVRRTRKALEPYPVRLRFLEKYFRELEERLATERSEVWLSYQNDRLDRIRWLMDKTDDGLATGMRLRIRPYDIPWLVFGMTRLDTPGFREKGQYNGWIENMDKMLACPGMKVEFTDRYADFCYLCQDLLADGCVRHPDFGDYGKIFPQPKQMSPKLRANCRWLLDHLGLEWTSVVEVREFVSRCVKRIPDPAAFPDFPEIEKTNWEEYRAGVRVLREWLARQG